MSESILSADRFHNTEDFPERLFRFYPVKYPLRTPLEHIKEVLQQHVIFFPRARQLRDRKDCLPPFRPPYLGAAEFYSRRGSEKHCHPSKVEDETNRVFATLHDPIAMSALWEKQREDFGVFSLTLYRDNQRMWDEYADKGRGVCIAFDFMPSIEDKLVDLLPAPVAYHETIPSASPIDGILDSDKGSEFIRNTLYAKTLDYAWESEWRLVVKLGPQIRRFPPVRLTDIYLGAHMSAAHASAVGRWAAKGTPSAILHDT